MMHDHDLLGGNHRHSSTGPGATALHAMAQIDSHQTTGETTLINATNATVAITTTAPPIAGLGKITPSNATPSNDRTKKKRIIVPTYSVNGGLDVKYDSNPRNVQLHNLVSSQEYEASINVINDNLKRYRNGAIDKACLVSGPLMIPLAVWGVRHNSKEKKRKKEMERSVNEFNERMEMEGRYDVRMFWNRSRSGESFLSIEEVEAGYDSSGGKGHKVD